LETSISAYYYTGMRNLFVGSLCAIAMFQLCCRGFDLKDDIAGVFSAICALGVAFFPVRPEVNATPLQSTISLFHYTFAALLFLTLSFFCLVLFKMTAEGKVLTPEKIMRNRVYTACGIVILLSLAAILVFKVTDRVYLFPGVGAVFFFETTSLVAFGIAWLTKGEAFLKDSGVQ
jgi:hypothetical protein